jgi:hypothetical protein
MEVDLHREFFARNRLHTKFLGKEMVSESIVTSTNTNKNLEKKKGESISKC